MSISTFKIGTGLTEYPSGGGSNTYTWGGKSFNPTENLVYGFGQSTRPIIQGESYNYNLSGVNAGTEVFLGLIVFEYDENKTREYGFLNPNSEWIWGPVQITINNLGGWARQWFGTGFRHGEIDINGTYTAVLRDASNHSINYNTSITVNNITTQLDRHDSGYLWIEGNQLAFVDGCNAESGSQIGYKHLIDNDGVSYSTGKIPGYIRIPTSGHGKIAYIDSSGVERRTRLADKQGVGYDGGQLPQSGKTPGYIWVANISQFHWTYLFFVGYDGNVYRISHSSPFGY